MRAREIKRRIKSALREFLVAEPDLLERNVRELAITGRLAFYLVPLFVAYRVDVEYDRHGLERKTLDLLPECGGTRRVIPDIVIHERGHDGHNVAVIELKKETNPEARGCDRAKLRGMREQLNYQVAALVEVPAGPGARHRKATIEWQ